MRSKERKVIPSVCFALVVSSLFAPALHLSGQQRPDVHRTFIYIFWAEGCPHCEEARPAIQKMALATPGVDIHEFEITTSEDNRALFREMAGRFGFEARYVPTTFIGKRYWVGYSEPLGREMAEALIACSKSGCPDARTWQRPPPRVERSEAVPGGKETSPRDRTEEAPRKDEKHSLEIPLIGAVDLDAQSLWISTSLIALVDGFNPCSLWVLSMLLALVLHTGSRKKVLLVGLVFLSVTSLIYAAFIAGLFSVMEFLRVFPWIHAAVAVVAGGIAVVNIKDYFWFGKGPSLTISADKKPGIFEKLRGVMSAADSLWALATATVVLAAGVSLVEFSCTAGFPVLWVNLVSTSGVTVGTFGLHLLLYMFIYQLDELAIFATAVLTLRASRFEEKHGRLLKLVGGSLMLVLALVMIFKPALLNNVYSSLLVFGSAFALTGLVVGISRFLLPRLGMQIGVERRAPGPP